MQQQSVVVETAAGRIRGIRHDGVESFLGIPYGETTADRNRWRPGVEKASWVGIRDAVSFGPPAPQIDSRLTATATWPKVLDLMYPRAGSPLEGAAISEDSLTVNVWTPADAQGLPVMVWLHGGGFAHGSGSEMMFAGDEIARTGRAIVVSVTHRIGLMGFLALDEVFGERFADGQVGASDLLLALEWVHRNIGAFGGNPETVTIFGQSGGGAKVATLMAMPRAKGLFQRAILQSGPVRWFGTAEAAREATAGVLDLLGLTAADADVLFDLPLRYLMAAQRRAQKAGIGWAPYIDGDLIPRRPFDSEPSDLIADVEMMIGSTSHDMSLLLTERDDYATLTFEAVAAEVEATFGAEGADFLQAERAAHPHENPPLILSRLLTSTTFRASAIYGASKKSRQSSAVYAYEFAYETDAHDGLLGATHSLDLPYIFGTVGRVPFAGTRAERFEVSRMMQDAWIAFATTGSPQHAGIPEWPRYDERSRATMVIDSEWGTKAGAAPGAPLVGPNLWPDLSH